jgi:hypothetical protein
MWICLGFLVFKTSKAIAVMTMTIPSTLAMAPYHIILSCMGS